MIGTDSGYYKLDVENGVNPWAARCEHMSTCEVAFWTGVIVCNDLRDTFTFVRGQSPTVQNWSKIKLDNCGKSCQIPFLAKCSGFDKLGF